MRLIFHDVDRVDIISETSTMNNHNATIGDGGQTFPILIECTSMLLIGVLCQFLFGAFQLYPIAMFGGAIWCIGNLTVVPIIESIGLSVGFSFWSLISLLVGGIVGHFGIFIKQDVPLHPVLNYAGFAIIAIAGIFYYPIKTGGTKLHDLTVEYSDSSTSGEHQALLKENWRYSPYAKVETQSKIKKKLIGFSLGVLAGTCYGLNMIPVKYLEEQNPNLGCMAFIFSFFLGGLVTSSVVTFIYFICKRTQSFVNPSSFTPAICSGLCKAVAQIAGFIALNNLGLTSSLPIMAVVPGIIAILWGILLFREINGHRNFMLLSGAFILTSIGIALVVFSNI